LTTDFKYSELIQTLAPERKNVNKGVTGGKKMKRYLSILLVLAFTVLIPSMALAATPSKNALDNVTRALAKLETDLKTAQEAYERYDKAGKLYEPSSRFLKACDLIEQMESAVNEPDYAYRNAIKSGWTKDNPEMKKCLDRVYEFYTGKAKIPDGHFIQYIDEEEYPENGALQHMCDNMRAAYINAREKGIEAADLIYEYQMRRDKRHQKIMESVERAKLDGSTKENTADFLEKPVYKRAMAIIERYEELCEKVLAEAKVKRDAVREEMKKLHKIYTEMDELLFKNISNSNYSNTDSKFADALDKFDNDLWTKYGSFIEGLAKKWAPKQHTNLSDSMALSNEVNATVQGLLGREWGQATQEVPHPGGMIANILIRRSYIPEIRKTCSTDLLNEIKRNIDSVKDRAENLQSEAFTKAVAPLPLVFQFDPDNKEAKELQVKFKDRLAKLDAELGAKIDAREWKPANGENAPSNAVELAEAAWKLLLNEKVWNGEKRHMIALRIDGPWRIQERNILQQPTMHGLPVTVVAQFDDQKGQNLCWSYGLMFFTRTAANIPEGLPFAGYAGGSRTLVRISKIKPGVVGSSIGDEYIAQQIAAIGATTAGSPGGSKTGPIGWAVRFGLSLLLVAAGLLAAATVITPKVAALKDPLSKLKPHSALIGVATLATGIVSFVLALLSFCPLAHILPQVTAVAVGLLLGKSILLKKSDKAAPVSEEKPAETKEDGAAEGADKETKTDKEKMEEKAAEVAEKAAEMAGKAADATGEAAQAAQDLLIKNKELFDKLEKVQIPIGIASIAFGVLHLLLGCFWLL
jgi:hypothetical protein